MLQYIQENPDIRRRFVKYAFNENSKIKSFEEFQSALFSAFDTKQGQNASKYFNNDEVNELFESPEAKDKVRDNVSLDEFNKIYKKQDHIVIRDIKKGEKIKPSQVASYQINKPIKVKREGRTYYKSEYQKWTKSQINFIKIRKAKKRTLKQIFHQYNKHFKESPRSKDSIQSKIYSI